MPGSIRSEAAREMAAKSAQARRLNAIERRVRALVEAAPPLTIAQRDRLALLLRAPSGDTA